MKETKITQKQIYDAFHRNRVFLPDGRQGIPEEVAVEIFGKDPVETVIRRGKEGKTRLPASSRKLRQAVNSSAINREAVKEWIDGKPAAGDARDVMDYVLTPEWQSDYSKEAQRAEEVRALKILEKGEYFLIRNKKLYLTYTGAESAAERHNYNLKKNRKESQK